MRDDPTISVITLDDEADFDGIHALWGLSSRRKRPEAKQLSTSLPGEETGTRHRHPRRTPLVGSDTSGYLWSELRTGISDGKIDLTGRGELDHFRPAFEIGFHEPCILELSHVAGNRTLRASDLLVQVAERNRS